MCFSKTIIYVGTKFYISEPKDAGIVPMTTILGVEDTGSCKHLGNIASGGILFIPNLKKFYQYC